MGHGLPDTLRAYVTKLADRVLLGEVLTDTEQRSWRSWQVYDGQTRTLGMPTRGHWLNWMGLLGSPVEAALAAQFPCTGTAHIPAAHGVVGLSAHTDRLCGQLCWCQNCQWVFKAVGRAWALPMMSDAIAQTLLVALQHWLKGSRDMQFTPYDAPVHRCGVNCSGYVELRSVPPRHTTTYSQQQAHLQQPALRNQGCLPGATS